MSEERKIALRHQFVLTPVMLCAALLSLAGTVTRAQDATGAPGCGPDPEHFDVKTTKNQHPEMKNEADKAVIYFLQDDLEFESIPRPVVRLGIDSKWVGATHGTSYLATTVEPGEHHLCASWQTNVTIGQPKQGAALHFTAEAGKSYFFSARDRWFRDHGSFPMKFDTLDTDEGRLLISQFAVATSKPKK